MTTARAYTADIHGTSRSMSRRQGTAPDVTERALSAAEENLKSIAESIARTRHTLDRLIGEYWAAHSELRVAARKVKP
jgi:hypothetical protein